MKRNLSTPVGLLRELIAIPSVNPAFLPSNNGWAGEQGVVDFLLTLARRGRLDGERQRVTGNRSNVLLRLSPPARPRRRLLLAPHLDTVGVAGADALRPRLRNGRVYGRGACDTKGSVAAMLAALLSVADSPRRPRQTEILFVGLVDEENAQLGSRAFARRHPKVDLAIVGEPTRLQVVTAHKGNVWLELEVRGRAAHGSRPELGCNAIYRMAEIVGHLETDYAEQLRHRAHPLLGHPSINVGTIQGGTQPNVVPSGCRITIDRRTLPGETEAGVRRELRTVLRTVSYPLRLRNLRPAACDPLETPPDLPWLAPLFRLVRQEGPVGVDYFCDAAVLAQGGIPSVVFGPGDIAQAHTSDEWIAVRSLERAAEVLRRFLETLP